MVLLLLQQQWNYILYNNYNHKKSNSLQFIPTVRKIAFVRFPGIVELSPRLRRGFNMTRKTLELLELVWNSKNFVPRFFRQPFGKWIGLGSFGRSPLMKCSNNLFKLYNFLIFHCFELRPLILKSTKILHKMMKKFN